MDEGHNEGDISQWWKKIESPVPIEFEYVFKSWFLGKQVRVQEDRNVTTIVEETMIL
jgi:hypothetical protein